MKDIPSNASHFIEEMVRAHRTPRLAGSLVEAAKEQEHLNGVIDMLKERELLLKLPAATILFLLEHTPDPADIIYNQIETLDFGERRYGENWSIDRQKYLKNLALLCRLPKNGVKLAIELSIESAVIEFKEYSRLTSHDNLQLLDCSTLALVCEEERRGRPMEHNDGRYPRGYLEMMHMDPLHSAQGFMEDIMEDARTCQVAGDRSEEIEHLIHETDHKAFVARFWFPLTLRYLRGIRRKRIAGFLMPRVGGHVLPVELQDAISACYHDADFLTKAPILAREGLKDIFKRIKEDMVKTAASLQLDKASRARSFRHAGV
ncbi:unnamed protein product [Cercospora beticola]|nr:unnamed protein product [Cercospora beticola]